MNKEIEIKVFLENPAEVEKKLRKIAKFVKEKLQKDEYFVPKHKDFFNQNPVTEYLRVRHEDGKNKIAYHFCHFDKKGALLETEEYETEVDNSGMMSTILKKLGMKHKITVTKYRKYFKYKNFEVLLDHIQELGFFLEIEAKNVKGTIQQIKKECYKLLDEFGAVWKKTPNKGYPDMILDKK